MANCKIRTGLDWICKNMDLFLFCCLLLNFFLTNPCFTKPYFTDAVHILKILLKNPLFTNPVLQIQSIFYKSIFTIHGHSALQTRIDIFLVSLIICIFPFDNLLCRLSKMFVSTRMTRQPIVMALLP